MIEQKETKGKEFEEMLREPACRVCGCTESRACPDGCYWVEEDLCSECLDLCEMLLADFGVSDRAPTAIVAIGYGLAAERVFGPPHDDELLAEMERAAAEEDW